MVYGWPSRVARDSQASETAYVALHTLIFVLLFYMYGCLVNRTINGSFEWFNMSDDQSRNYAQELEAMKRKYQELVSETETVRAKVISSTSKHLDTEYMRVLSQVICLESEKTEANRELKRCREALIAQKRGLAGYQEHVQAKRELENQVEK